MGSTGEIVTRHHLNRLSKHRSAGMAFKKWFGKKDEEEKEVFQDYILERMKVGFLVDYDLDTWEVVGYNTYD
jgi:hypothetical protein